MHIENDRITMRCPDNWHAHFRQGQLMIYLILIFIQNGWWRRVLAEPNTVPPKLTGKEASDYRKEITDIARQCKNGEAFQPVATIQITETTSAEMIREAYEYGVKVCKVYPRYVTTHSENGVVDYTKIYPALAECERLGMVVQFHPEHPSYEVMGRLKEEAFIAILEAIRKAFPRLKISVEHVSSRVMINWVKAQDEFVGASLTIHHKLQTADDLAGYSKASGGLVCVHDGAFKPGAKDPEDRDAVREAALSGNPKFWYGGDDAAHLKSKKETARCACGAWNTIAALPLLIALFESAGRLEFLEAFLSEHGSKFYGYPLNEGTVTFERKKWTIPAECEVPGMGDSIVPFFAGREMDWKLVA